MEDGEGDLREVSRVLEGLNVAVAHESDELHKLAGRNLHRCGGVCGSGCHPHGCWNTGTKFEGALTTPMEMICAYYIQHYNVHNA